MWWAFQFGWVWLSIEWSSVPGSELFCLALTWPLGQRACVSMFVLFYDVRLLFLFLFLLRLSPRSLARSNARIRIWIHIWMRVPSRMPFANGDCPSLTCATGRSKTPVRNWKNVSSPGVKWRVNRMEGMEWNEIERRSWHAFCASCGQNAAFKCRRIY